MPQGEESSLKVAGRLVTHCLAGLALFGTEWLVDWFATVTGQEHKWWAIVLKDVLPTAGVFWIVLHVAEEITPVFGLDLRAALANTPAWLQLIRDRVNLALRRRKRHRQPPQQRPITAAAPVPRPGAGSQRKKRRR